MQHPTEPQPLDHPPHPEVRSFTLRYAARWTTVGAERDATTAQYLYRRQAPFTGDVVTTADGSDVTFSDISV